MAATGVNLNWSSVSFASSPLAKITGGGFDDGGGVITFGADANQYPILAAIGMNNPTASFQTADVGAIHAINVGASGALVATLNDAKAATGGAVTFTMSNAVVSNVNSSGQHAQFAGGTISFIGISSDGTTNPIAISRS